MRTKNQKYRRSHWWKFTDWEKVFWSAFLVVIIGTGIYGIIYVIVHSEKQVAAANDSIVDSVTDSVAVNSVVDSTLIVDSIVTKSAEETKSEVKTKSDDAVFDSTIGGTRVVIKTNRPIRVVVK